MITSVSILFNDGEIASSEFVHDYAKYMSVENNLFMQLWELLSISGKLFDEYMKSCGFVWEIIYQVSKFPITIKTSEGIFTFNVN